MWRINTDPPPDSATSFAAEGSDKWWDQVDLVKLILAANQIKEIPDDVRLLTALTILDVSVTCVCIYGMIYTYHFFKCNSNKKLVNIGSLIIKVRIHRQCVCVWPHSLV